MDSCTYSTAWGFILYGTGSEYQGVDPDIAIRMESYSKKIFASISVSPHAEAYWERIVKKDFQICKNDYKFKVIPSWKELFKQYCKERFDFNRSQEQLIETMVAHCHKIYAFKTTSSDHNTIFNLLAPFKDYLLNAHSNADAQFFLGYCYQFGVNANLDQAIKYLQLSADQGQILAKNNLGDYFYKRGDFEKAFSYFKSAADLGFAIAQINVSVCYRNGNGVDKDLEQAFIYAKMSAEQENAVGLFDLGCAYHFGNGVDKDLKQAFDCFKRSAVLGHAAAQYNLSLIFSQGKVVEINPSEAFKYAKLSAEQGNADAQGDLSYYYMKGFGTTVNSEKAFRFAQMAAEQEHAIGLFNLGYCYRNGIGIEIDLKKALEYTQKAVDQGCADAESYLEEIKKLLEQEAKAAL